MLNEIQKNMLKEIANLHKVPEGAYNIRANGQTAGRNSTANIQIVSKTDVSGIDIHIKDGTVNESVHIPVVLSESGLKETVYNDFFIGENCDVVIIAGCGISNCGDQDSRHDGVHRLYAGKNSHVKYVEKHYGEGDGMGKRIMNPRTEVYQSEGSTVEMEMVQIKGVDSTVRTTVAKLDAGAKLLVRERLMTHGEQHAESGYTVELKGPGSSADVVSRSVARENSYQKYDSRIVGNSMCSGHTECDAIIMDNARVLAVFGSIYRLLVRRGLPPDTPSDAPEFAAFLQSCVPALEPQDAEALLALAQAAQFGAGTMTEQDTDKMRKLYQVIKHTGKRKQSQKSVEKQSQE